MRAPACSLLVGLPVLLLSLRAAAAERDVTTVVLMRDGTDTVLSIRASHHGDPGEFELIIPVPHTVDPGDVEVIDPAVFERVETLSAPRLVEFWERDPCKVRPVKEYDRGVGRARSTRSFEPNPPPVETELETELELVGYDITVRATAESKQLIVRLDPAQLQPDGRLDPPPLQLHYTADELVVPAQLTARGGDLVVYVLARERRYEPRDRLNVTIPSNVRVREHVRGQFSEFYASLLDHVFTRNPNTFITEHAAILGFCHPCTTTPLTAEELGLLGADQLPSYAPWYRGGRVSRAHERQMVDELVLTRMRTRLDPSKPAEDQLFHVASSIVGGVGTPDPEYPMEHHARAPQTLSRFQARYLILHEWPGPHDCAIAHRGYWSRPWKGHRGRRPEIARGVEHVQGRIDLREAIPAAEWVGLGDEPPPTRVIEPLAPRTHDDPRGCAHCSVASDGGPLTGLVSAALGLLACLGLRRRPRR